jgi:hypothetical protein
MKPIAIGSDHDTVFSETLEFVSMSLTRSILIKSDFT